MLICFAHAKHNDLGICSTWFMGCGDSSLKVHNWCHGCPTPKELTQLSVNLTMEKAGKECRDAFNYTTSPLSCCSLFHYSFAKERTTLAIQHSHIRRTIGCLIWELRKCCIFASPKAGFFWTIVFVIQTPSNSDGTCWRVSIPSFYDAHVETSTLSMSFKHICMESWWCFQPA